MKYKLYILLVILLICFGGCQNAYVDGVSLGAMHFDASAGDYDIDEWMPMGLVNIKFGEK